MVVLPFCAKVCGCRVCDDEIASNYDNSSAGSVATTYAVTPASNDNNSNSSSNNGASNSILSDGIYACNKSMDGHAIK